MASVPASVTVGRGHDGCGFTVTTTAVERHDGGHDLRDATTASTRTATVTVTPPPPPPPQTATLTVTATGRSGERVTSTPAGISVATGAQRLGVVHARDVDHAERRRTAATAIWSGACSSGGNKIEDLHLHAERSASVTANVQ